MPSSAPTNVLKLPTLSIITPTLGRSKYLLETIESVGAQFDVASPNRVSVEHVIVSPLDFDMVDIGRDRPFGGPESQGNVTSINWLRTRERGPADAINRGMHRASGQIIGCVDDDDVLLPQALPTIAKIFASHPEIDLVYAGFHQIDEESVSFGSRVPRPFSLGRLKRKSLVQSPSFFFRRRLLGQVGPLDGTLRYHYWHEFSLRCALQGFRFFRETSCLAAKRRHRGNRYYGMNDPHLHLDRSDELLAVSQKLLQTIPARIALLYGHCRTTAEGIDQMTPGYDRSVIRHALKAQLSANNNQIDTTTSIGSRTRLMLTHARIQLAHAIKYPRDLVRILPQRMGLRVRSILRSRLFQLQQHAPRALSEDAGSTVSNACDGLSIGIVTPNLNQGAFLDRTIQSVVQQNYSNLRYVVQDGGSNDQSVSIIKRHARHLHHWESRSDSGQTQAINRGMQWVDTDIYAYLNSDDLLLPGSLAYVSRYFRSHPNVDVIYGHRIVIDENDQEVGRWILPKHDDNAIAFADYIPQETMFWRRRAWEAVGNRLDESFQFAMDWDLILRFRAERMKFVRVPRFLAAFRVIETQKTQVLLETVGATEMNRLRIRELGHVPTPQELRRAIRPYRMRQWFQHHATTILGSTRSDSDS